MTAANGAAYPTGCNIEVVPQSLFVYNISNAYVKAMHMSADETVELDSFM
jgi:hypothetical protein